MPPIPEVTKRSPSRVPATTTWSAKPDNGPKDGLLTDHPPVNLGKPGASRPVLSMARMSEVALPSTR